MTAEQVRPVCSPADTPAGLGGAETGGRSLTCGRETPQETVRGRGEDTQLDSEQPPPQQHVEDQSREAQQVSLKRCSVCVSRFQSHVSVFLAVCFPWIPAVGHVWFLRDAE